MIKAILIFALCSIVNVMLNTVKTIIMYRNEKLSSSIINAITYGFYTVIVVLMAGEMALWLKIILTAGTNFIGVWLSMLILEKLRKDKLWCIDTTIREEKKIDVSDALSAIKVPYSIINVESDFVLFKIYCKTQAESGAVREILKRFNAKYFVAETKSL